MYGILDDNAANSRISAAIKKGTTNGLLQLPRFAFASRLREFSVHADDGPSELSKEARVAA